MPARPLHQRRSTAATVSPRGRPARRTRPQTTVVIPVFNHAALTSQCLGTLVDHENCELIVVDDASTDNTPAVLASFGPRIRVARHAANRGFAASCNTGAALANCEYILFLNNDTIPQPGWLAALERYAKDHPEAAVVGAKLLYPNNTIQHAGVAICQDHYPRHIYTGFPADHAAVSKSRRFQIVTAACMLLRRILFKKAGGFDTGFRNGFEDVDLCLRLGERGHQIHYCAESVVRHLESVSPGRFKHDAANVALYRRRWLSRVQADDLRYYTEDGLLHLTYEGCFPFALEVSPLLATLDGGMRHTELEHLLQQRSREVADLRRENTRLAAELGRRPGTSPALSYQQLRQRIRNVVEQHVPPGATVLVVSKGDSALLDLPGRRAWHFPQTPRGTYAGHHPADSAEAIAHLESLRAKGAGYLVIPETSRWWLDHYGDFRKYLNRRRRIRTHADSCVIFSLGDEIPTRFRPSKPHHL